MQRPLIVLDTKHGVEVEDRFVFLAQHQTKAGARTLSVHETEEGAKVAAFSDKRRYMAQAGVKTVNSKEWTVCKRKVLM